MVELADRPLRRLPPPLFRRSHRAGASGKSARHGQCVSRGGERGHVANELRYGDRIHLQNGYNSWQGGYLDTNGGAGDSGAKYGVSTADTPTRGTGTGTWEVLSVSGKAHAAPGSSAAI